MKNTIQALATFMLIFIGTLPAFSSNDSGKEKLSTILKDGIMEISYENSSQQELVINVKDSEGTLVHQQEVPAGERSTGYIDFDQLGDGHYTVELSGNKKFRKEVAVFKDASIALVRQNFSSYQLLYGKKESTKVKVQFVNQSGEIVMEDTFISNRGFSKTYKVSKWRTDATTLRMITESDSKEFKL